MFLNIVCALAYDVNNCHLPGQFLTMAQFLAVVHGLFGEKLKEEAWTLLIYISPLNEILLRPKSENNVRL